MRTAYEKFGDEKFADARDLFFADVLDSYEYCRKKEFYYDLEHPDIIDPSKHVFIDPTGKPTWKKGLKLLHSIVPDSNPQLKMQVRQDYYQAKFDLLQHLSSDSSRPGIIVGGCYRYKTKYFMPVEVDGEVRGGALSSSDSDFLDDEDCFKIK